MPGTMTGCAQEKLQINKVKMGDTPHLLIYGKDRILLSKQFEESSSALQPTYYGNLIQTNNLYQNRIN